MPINYQPAQPFSPSISSAYGQAMQNSQDFPQMAQMRQRQSEQNQNAAIAAAQINARAYSEDADRQQNAINNRDRQAFETDKFAASLQPSARDMFQADVESRQQEQRFQMQAKLQETELTQQEKIRLQRLKNAMGAVNTDPTLTDEQKSDFNIQLQTGINPLEGRLANAKIKSENALREGQLENTRAQAAQRQEQAKFASMSFEELHREVPQGKALAEIVEEINMATPGLDPKEVEAKARALAIKRGLTDTWVMSKPGAWERVDRAKGQAGGEGGEAGGNVSKAPKELDDAGAIRQARARVEGQGVSKDDDGYNDKVAEAFKAVMSENKGKVEQSKAGGKPKPLDPEVKREALNTVATQAREYEARTDLDPRVQSNAIAASRAIHGWIDKYGSYDAAPESVKKQFEQYEKFLKTIPPKPDESSQPVPAAGQKVEYDAAGRAGVWVPSQSAPRTIGGDLKRAQEKFLERPAAAGERGINSAGRQIKDWTVELGNYLGR